MIEQNEILNKQNNINNTQFQISDNLFQEVAFYALLPKPTEFFLLQKTLNKIKNGEQKYKMLLKNFNKLPEDKFDYKKIMEIIKQKIEDELYQKFKQKIDALFASEFIQIMKPVLKDILDSEPTKNNLTDIACIANRLIKRKQKDQPQLQLLKTYLFAKTQQLDLDQDFKVQKLTTIHHANDVYLVSNTEIDQYNPNTFDYYAKTFTQDYRTYAKNGLIDPNQLFLYKVLQFTGFGPQCWFLMKTGSSSYGTISRGNFILTKNLGKAEETHFLLDNEENKEIFKQIFSNSKKFAIEISAAAAINDIIALWDTFKNSGNYGVVFYNNSLKKLLENKDSYSVEYRIMFIDHLPNANNGILSQLNRYKKNNDQRYNTTKYSPRENLIDYHQINPNTLVQLAKHSKQIGITKDKIIKEVYQRLCEDELQNKSVNKLKTAFQKAKEYVIAMIKQYAVNFYSNQEKSTFAIQQDYYRKMLSNLQMFNKKYKEDTNLEYQDIQ